MRTMRLILHVPGQLLVDAPVAKIEAEGPQGFFILLPRHADIVTRVQAGLLRHVTPEGVEHFTGIDSGMLVKCGDEVRIAVRGAVAGTDLDDLRRAVRRRFLVLDEHEQAARSALARLEAGAIRALVEIER